MLLKLHRFSSRFNGQIANVCTRVHSSFPVCTHPFSPSLFTICTRPSESVVNFIANFHRLPSGNWRALVRRRNQVASRSFRLKTEAELWAREVEQSLDAGRSIVAPKLGRRTPFKTLVQLHLGDLKEVGRQARRSKAYTLEKLQVEIGHIQLCDLNREFLLDYGKRRAKTGAGPVTLGMEIGYIRTVLVHAAAVHGSQGQAACRVRPDR